MADASQNSPTVVLVHGAFADAGSWAGVTELLLAAGAKVLAPANPLRGIRTDSDYMTKVFAQVDGPVLAVGHSYGGAIITNAASQVDNVVGLVYVAAFAPEENESLGEREGTSRDSVLSSALQPREFPNGTDGATAVELYVDPKEFHRVFSSDLPEAQSAVLAASQRPVAASAFEEKSGAAAWKTLPSWAVVATGDKAAGADVIRAMAERAGAEIRELEGSHVIMISQPQAVADVILAALEAVS